MKRFFKHSLAGICVFLLILFPLFFTACSMNGDDSSGKEKPTASTKVDFPSKADPDGGDISTEANLYSSTFADACSYNETLAVASLCLAEEGSNKKQLGEFFNDITFDTYEAYNGANYDYDRQDIAESISYGLAHKLDPYDNNHIIAVAIRGVSYSAEWVSNFNLGESGDHHGFSNAAKIVYDGLKKYINAHYAEEYKNKKIKLWITGYSRSAAVANVLSYYILTGLDSEYAKLDIDQTKVFTYTFATPRSLIKEHAIAYPNVFNHVSKADMVTYIVPEAYGLYRCGTDKILFDCDKSKYITKKDAQAKYDDYIKYQVSYTSVVDKWLKEFNSEIDLPDFCVHTLKEYKDNRVVDDFPGSEYKTEEECIEFFIKKLLEAGNDKTDQLSFKSREEFVERSQETISYLIQLYMSNSSQFSIFMAKLKDNMFDIIGAMGSQDSFTNYIVGKMEESGIQIRDKDILKKHIGILYDSANPTSTTGSLSQIVLKYALPMMLSGNTDLQRIIKQHYPEVTLVTLLKSF